MLEPAMSLLQNESATREPVMEGTEKDLSVITGSRASTRSSLFSQPVE